MPDILPSILEGFQKRFPEVEVELRVENGLVDIIAKGCDAGIRYGQSLALDMISIPIGPRSQRFALAASADYLGQHGTPEAPEDLSTHFAIRYRLPGGQLLPWRLEKQDRHLEVCPQTRLILGVNALDSGLAYARRSLGIIGVFRNWAERDFAAGNLIPVLEDWWPEREGPRLYYPNRLVAAPLRAFIDFAQQGQPPLKSPPSAL